MLDRNIAVYLDDILLFEKTEYRYKHIFSKIFNALRIIYNTLWKIYVHFL